MIGSLRLCCCLLLGLCATGLNGVRAEEPGFPLNARRILFVGDSITNAGGYIAIIETQLKLQGLNPCPEIYNLGLSSETCTGLSEPDHPFPRPNVHDRLDRALEVLKPDVLVACYGMNDGIYYPFSEERFAAYQAGIRKIVDKAHAAGAKVILMTPPPFDSHPVREKVRPAGAEEYAYYAAFVDYDQVLVRYGKWIMNGEHRAEMVVDLHQPLEAATKERRKTDPDYTIVPDGVHPNADGHQLMAETILRAWGVPSFETMPNEILAAVKTKIQTLHGSYMTFVGHTRPGVKPGIPVDEAKQVAAELDQIINQRIPLDRAPKGPVREMNRGTRYQLHYPADLTGTQLRISVDYSLWIPQDLKTIRGVIVHQHGCGVGASLGGRTAADDLHWQELARRTNCALLGPAYEARDGLDCRLWCDSRNGSEARFLQALEDLAVATNHPELTSVPWCLWGHSGGGFWASLMQINHADRIVAIWFRSGTAYPYWAAGEIAAVDVPEAAYRVPMMGNPGVKERDHERFQRAWNGLTAMQEAYQKAGADFFEFAGDPLTGHECGASRYLAIPYFKFWLEHRLPEEGSLALKDAKAALPDWQKTMQPLLEEYRANGLIADTTPPPGVSAVDVQQQEGAFTISWQPEIDFESGVQGFRIYRDEKEIATLPEKALPHYGYELWQGLSYHDTPTGPTPEFRYVDRPGEVKSKPTYRVEVINGAGLMSTAP